MIQQITDLSNIDKAVIPRKVSFEGFLLDLESFAKPDRLAELDRLARPDRLGEAGGLAGRAGTKTIGIISVQQAYEI